MSEDGTFGDHVFLQVAASVLNRQIVIYPVLETDGDGEGKIVINPGGQTAGNPLYLLYYSKNSFSSPHYQSICSDPIYICRLSVNVNIRF